MTSESTWRASASDNLAFSRAAARHLRGHDHSASARPLFRPESSSACARRVTAAIKAAEPDYPLAPHYLVHVGDDGAVLLPYTQAKQVLDRLKKLCIGRDLPDATACVRFDKVNPQRRKHGRRAEATGSSRRRPSPARRKNAPLPVSSHQAAPTP